MNADETPARPERLSRADAARWHMATPKNPMVIGALLLFDQRLTLEALEELVRGKLVPHRRFRQHVVESPHRFGAPRWRDDAAFDLRAHVRKLNPPGPVDAATLVGLVSERMSAPLPRDRSPWTFELVDLLPRVRAPGEDPPLHRGRAGAGRASRAARGRRLRRGRSARPTEQLPIRTSSPPTRAHRFSASSPDSSDSSHCRAIRTACCAVLSAATSASPGRKRSRSTPIKSIAGARGHHVTDVLLAGVAGALDRYARDHGQVPRSVRALLPVALPSEVIGR